MLLLFATFRSWKATELITVLQNRRIALKELKWLWDICFFVDVLLGHACLVSLHTDRKPCFVPRSATWLCRCCFSTSSKVNVSVHTHEVVCCPPFSLLWQGTQTWQGQQNKGHCVAQHHQTSRQSRQWVCVSDVGKLAREETHLYGRCNVSESEWNVLFGLFF